MKNSTSFEPGYIIIKKRINLLDIFYQLFWLPVYKWLNNPWNIQWI